MESLKPILIVLTLILFVTPALSVEISIPPSNINATQEKNSNLNNSIDPLELLPIGNKTLGEGEPLSFSLNVSGGSGYEVQYSCFNIPEGALFDDEMGIFSWWPDYEQAGEYCDVRFEVQDGNEVDYDDICIVVEDVWPRWDVNMDGIVGKKDFLIVLDHYKEVVDVPGPRYDVNCDGRVNVIDIKMIWRHRGEVVDPEPTVEPTVDPTAVRTPEPTPTPTPIPTLPAAITYLSASNPTANSVVLTWTAPSDDGTTGTAISYDIMYSTSNITEANWALTTQVTGEPAPAISGTTQTMTISGLDSSTTYYFTMKSSDEVLNISGLSNVVNIETLQTNWSWESLHLNGGGYISSLAIDPQNPNIIYAGCDVGGMFKSTDYGNSWRIINKGLRDDADYSIVAIAIHPDNSNIIYIATGKAWGLPSGNYGGIYKSNDSGENWELLTNEVKFTIWDKRQNGGDLISISPTNPDIIYASSYYDGVFKSTDGGTNWVNKTLNNQYLSGVTIHPTNSSIVYVTARDRGTGTNYGIFKSTDGGDNWSTLRDDLDTDGLIIDSSYTDILYAVCNGSGVFKSTDGGLNWVNKSSGLEFITTSSNPYIGQYVTIALDPNNSSILYVASHGYIELYKSIDAGENWINLYSADDIYLDGWWGYKGWFAMHTNQIIIDPQNSSRVYIGDYHKVWRSDDKGDTWHIKPWGLETTCLPTVVIDPDAPEKIYVGGMDVGLFKSGDFGESFQRLGFGNVWDIAIDSSTNPNTIFIAEGRWGGAYPHSGGVYKSTDEGENWNEISNGMPDLRALQVEINPENPQIMYAGLERGVGNKTGIYKSTDGGANWLQKSNSLPENIDVHSIVINPNNTSIIYIRDWSLGIFKSTDAGENWVEKNDGISKVGANNDYKLKSLAIDPNNSDVLYVGGEWRGVYKTTDGGGSWQIIFDNFNGFAVSVDVDSTVYIAGRPWSFDPEDRDLGIYKSTNGGQNWSSIHSDNGLVNFAISQITIDTQTNDRIYLASSGNGLFRGIEGK